MTAAVLRKASLLAAGALALVVLVGLPTLGQGVTDPSGELADAECYGHHKQEGFRSVDIFPQVIEQAPRSGAFEFRMTVRNPWLHELQDMYGYINATGAPGIALPGGKDPVETPARTETIQGGPDKYVVRTFPLPIDTNATEAVVRVVGSPGTQVPAPALRDKANDFDLTVTSPDGSIVLTGPDPSPLTEDLVNSGGPYTWDEEVRVNQLNLTNGGPGEWTITVAYRGFDREAAFSLGHGVYYNVTGVLLVPGPARLGPNEAYEFVFPLSGRESVDLQSLRYGVITVAYHQHTDKNIGDYGNYDKWNTIQFPMGDEFRTQGIAVDTGAGADLLGPVLRRWAQVLGFVGSFLILPSLVFGGTFGKRSVVWLNDRFGGPRRRVLFHNTMSFWLLGISVLHMFLFFYEAFWNWSHGLVWGGLALACMIGLGVTGAIQRRFVARWGFNRWRFLHFAMGILVFVFVLVHIVADGSHLAPVREQFFGGSANTLSGIDM